MKRLPSDHPHAVSRWKGRARLWLPAAALAHTLGACGDDPPTGADDTDIGSEGSATQAAAESTGDGTLGRHTYHADARPILERHCIQCHSDDGISFSLTDYDAVVPYREAIANAIDNGSMPPWGMADDCNTFAGDFSLTDEDRQTLLEWIDDEAPEGDQSQYAPPEPLSIATLSRTDLTLQLPEPYQPTLAPDDYHCFVLDWPHDEQMFITGVEIDPDNEAIVHHLLLYLAEPQWVDDFTALDAAEDGPGYTCFGGPGGGNLPSYFGPTLAVWAPGNQMGDFPEGTGIEITPGSKLIVQVHYNTLADNGVPDQSTVALKTDAEVDRPAHLVPWAAPLWRRDQGMRIPAGDDNVQHEFTSPLASASPFLAPGLPIDVDVDVYMATHHMHGLGSSGGLEIKRSNGDTTCLVDVPRYDFNWQLMYRLAEPVLISASDEVRIHCGFDNSAGTQDVFWGDGTAEEMCLGFFYAVPR